MDGRLGRVVNGDLADYHVPVEADVPNLEVPWIGAPDERGARARDLRPVARARRRLQSLGGAALISPRQEPGSRSRARSPRDTMPTGRPLSTTGTRRMERSRMRATAASTVSSGAMVVS